MYGPIYMQVTLQDLYRISGLLQVTQVACNVTPPAITWGESLSIVVAVVESWIKLIIPGIHYIVMKVQSISLMTLACY